MKAGVPFAFALSHIYFSPFPPPRRKEGKVRGGHGEIARRGAILFVSMRSTPWGRALVAEGLFGRVMLLIRVSSVPRKGSSASRHGESSFDFFPLASQRVRACGRCKFDRNSPEFFRDSWNKFSYFSSSLVEKLFAKNERFEDSTNA